AGEAHAPDGIVWGPPNARAPHGLAQPPGLSTAVKGECPGQTPREPANEPGPDETDGGEGQDGEETGKDDDQARGHVVDGGPHQIAPQIRHGGSSFGAARGGTRGRAE